jgi:hypothetical protein
MVGCGGDGRDRRSWRWDDYLTLAVALAFGVLLVFLFQINHRILEWVMAQPL